MEDIKNKNIVREIDIVGVAKQIFAAPKSLAKFVCFFAVLGIIVALNKPKEYTAQVILAPELASGGLGMSESLSSMASTFGIDLGQKSSYDAIYPEIYPDIFASTDFILTLLDIKVRQLDNDTEKTYYQHLKEDKKTPFWSYPGIWLNRLIAAMIPSSDETGGKGINPFHLTKEQEGICGAIRNAISCMIDKKTSVITISVTDYDAQIAAVLADTLQHRLQDYIIDYRTKKARIDLDYYEKLYRESKSAYNKAQRTYAAYADANQDAQLQAFIAKRDELENEMQIKFNVYSQMVTQVQNAQAKVQEKTPAFTIIQSATIPNRASSTPRSIVVLGFIFLGFFANAIWILYLKPFINNRKKKTATEE